MALLGDNGNITPRDVINSLRTQYGVKTTYATAWKALKKKRESALDKTTPSPFIKKKVGRPKNVSIGSGGETMEVNHLLCSICGESAHNRRTCLRRQQSQEQVSQRESSANSIGSILTDNNLTSEEIALRNYINKTGELFRSKKS
jgi:hypothetical protein